MNDSASVAELTESSSGYAAPKKKRGRALMLLAPLALLIAAGVYMWNGRFVSTDNAYIRADIANISPEISGQVQEVLVKDNQVVKAGQPLLKLDSLNYEILQAGAEASMRNTVASINADRIDYRQHQQDLKIAQSEYEFAQRQYDRQLKLASSSAGAESARDSAKRSLDVAREKVTLTQEEIKQALAKLFGDPDIPVEKHPKYQEAMAQEAVASLQIKRATVLAPFDGVISHVPQVGDYARTGVTVMTLVSTEKIWVDANFKETELTNMKPGQPVDVEVDTYPGHIWHGQVESIAQATGAEFALLPAQNATGNWVKVVQRVPVKIVLKDIASGPPLRAGLSVEATVDTGARRIDAWLK